MLNDYRIVIPSRKRSKRIKTALSIVPTATVVVRAEEEGDYKDVVPKTGELVILPQEFVGGISKIRKWIMDNFKEHTIVMLDDDLECVRCLVGKRIRHYIEPDVVLRIIENSIQITRDLGISLFYWNRQPNPMQFNAADPVRFSGDFAAAAFGINGRKINFDPRLTTREDVDITMQALLKDRITYSDLRYYFDFGPVWSSKGGNQGIRTSENEERDKKLVYKKWGQSNINLDVRKGKSTGARNLVKRRSSL